MLLLPLLDVLFTMDRNEPKVTIIYNDDKLTRTVDKRSLERMRQQGAEVGRLLEGEGFWHNMCLRHGLNRDGTEAQVLSAAECQQRLEAGKFLEAIKLVVIGRQESTSRLLSLIALIAVMVRPRGQTEFDYAFRLTIQSDLDVGALTDWLSVVFDNFLACREEASQPHAHVYGRGRLKLKGLQASVRKAFPLHVGNAGYSLKECDSQVYDYLKYICKGVSVDVPPVLVARQGLEYTDEYIDELHQAYWVTNEELAKNSKKRDQLKLRGSVVEQLEKQAKHLKLEGHDRREVAQLYVAMYVDARKPVNVFHAKGVVNTVCALLSGHQFDQLVEACAER